jgi:D-alanyl-D-alanine carboxypeptidase (penicillin-binding protein 5/6)
MPKDPVPLRALLDPHARTPGRPPPARGQRPWVPVAVALVLVCLLSTVLALARFGRSADPTVDVAPVSAPSAAPVEAPAVTAAPSPTVPPKPSRAKLAVKAKLTAAGPKPSLPWPTSGQAKVEIAGIGVIGRSGPDRAVPIASITKVMTAYTILRDHPLGAGQDGPSLTVTEAEAAAYPEQKAAGESVVVVEAGEELTEREALTGLLVASGGNLADILARWDAGSESAFVATMNRNAQRLGMSSTHYVDASGLDPGSVSTASDLLKLAPAAMAQPALAELVGTSSASIPLNPNLKNPNALLGVHGVIGIKTGTTTAAGGCLLFAAERTVAGRTSTIYGAVLGISGDRSTIHSNARDAGDALVVGAGDQLHRIALLKAGQTVATLVDRHGVEVRLTVAKTVSVIGWSGQKFRFALPSSLRTGRAPAKLTVHTPTRTFTVKLVKA